MCPFITFYVSFSYIFTAVCITIGPSGFFTRTGGLSSSDTEGVALGQKTAEVQVLKYRRVQITRITELRCPPVRVKSARWAYRYANSCHACAERPLWCAGDTPLIAACCPRSEPRASEIHGNANAVRPSPATELPFLLHRVLTWFPV